jgi:diketogulonate reductase-like aldo/keto reductase
LLKIVEANKVLSVQTVKSARPAQVAENIAASDLPSLSADTMKKIRAIYDAQIKPLVHPYW